MAYYVRCDECDGRIAGPFNGKTRAKHAVAKHSIEHEEHVPRIEPTGNNSP